MIKYKLSSKDFAKNITNKVNERNDEICNIVKQKEIHLSSFTITSVVFAAAVSKQYIISERPSNVYMLSMRALK